MKLGPSLPFVVLAWITLGCSDDAQKGVPACNREACSEACLDLAGGDCDVLQASCQARLFDAVSCVRGNDGKLPEIRALTEDEVRGERGDDDPDADAGADDAGTDDAGTGAAPVVDLEKHWDTALRLLGLRTPQTEDESVEFLGGYYDANERRITLVDRGKPQDNASAQRLLAHELVHSLQDQNMGLTDLRRSAGRSSDARLALGCLTEGDAELHMELAWSLLRGLSIDEDYWDASIEWDLKYSRDAVINAASPSEQVWLLRYAVGSRYLFDLWRSEGSWAVEALYESPPLATIFWMNGLAANRARTEPLSESLACNYAEVPEHYERAYDDTLGAFNLFAFLGRHLTEKGVYQTEKSWQRALSWRQDHLEVFYGPAGETALSWRIRLADEKTATDIARELEKTDLMLRIEQRELEVEIFASDSPAALEGFKPTRAPKCPEPDP